MYFYKIRRSDRKRKREKRPFQQLPPGLIINFVTEQMIVMLYLGRRPKDVARMEPGERLTATKEATDVMDDDVFLHGIKFFRLLLLYGIKFFRLVPAVTSAARSWVVETQRSKQTHQEKVQY